jgi:hypothetical protein
MAESRKVSRQHPGMAGTPRQEPAKPSVNETDELVLTLDKKTREVLKVARLDATGRRHELTEEESAELAGKGVAGVLVHALDDAFEAGLAEGLGTRSEEDEVDDDALVRLLVSGEAARDASGLGLSAMLLRPLLLRRLLRQHVPSAPDVQPQNKQPAVDRPAHGRGNGAASH